MKDGGSISEMAHSSGFPEIGGLANIVDISLSEPDLMLE